MAAGAASEAMDGWACGRVGRRPGKLKDGARGTERAQQQPAQQLFCWQRELVGSLILSEADGCSEGDSCADERNALKNLMAAATCGAKDMGLKWKHNSRQQSGG